MISFALDSAFHGFKMIYWNPIGGLYFFLRFYFGKMWSFWKKWLFFQADMAGFGKCCTGGCGRIGVCRVKQADAVESL